MKTKQPSWQEQRRAAEAAVNLSVIDVEEAGTACLTCGATGVVYTVHCWREETRPVLALCKACTERRAGGASLVHVNANRVGLRAGWQAGTRAVLSEKQLAARHAGAAARRRSR
jgi:hypothetical protein